MKTILPLLAQAVVEFVTTEGVLRRKGIEGPSLPKRY